MSAIDHLMKRLGIESYERLQTIALVAMFVLSLPILTPYLRGDGTGYYAYVASAVIDQDLYLENEFRHADPGACGKYFDHNGDPLENRISQTGMFLNKYTVGPAIMWTPFFVAAHAGVTSYNAVASEPIPADGFSGPYLWMTAFGTAVFGFLSLLLCRRLAIRLGVAPSATFWMVVGLWLASSLLVYTYFLPFYPHAHCALLTIVFIGYWWRTYEAPSPDNPTLRKPVAWFVLGLIAGFMLTTYYLNLPMWLFMAADGLVMFHFWFRSGATPGTWASRIGATVLPAAAGALLASLPHFYVRWLLTGDPFQSAYGDSMIVWSDPHPLRELFSTKQGLLTFTPIMFLAVAGMVPLVRRVPALGGRMLIVMGVFWYLLACYEAGHYGSSFGNRYFLTILPCFALGLAFFFDACRRRLLARHSEREPLLQAALGVTIALLIVWNLGFVFQWGTNIISNRSDLSFREVAVNQFTVVPERITGKIGALLFNRSALIDEIEQEDLSDFKVIAAKERKGVCKR